MLFWHTTRTSGWKNTHCRLLQSSTLGIWKASFLFSDEMTTSPSLLSTFRRNIPTSGSPMNWKLKTHYPFWMWTSSEMLTSFQRRFTVRVRFLEFTQISDHSYLTNIRGFLPFCTVLTWYVPRSSLFMMRLKNVRPFCEERISFKVYRQMCL